MAQWQSLDDEDDFFGDAEGTTSMSRRCEDGYEMDAGLARAEAFATEERYRNIGYHESYDNAKEERLQAGFEAGYLEAFEQSQRIGQILGHATMKSKRNTTPSQATASIERQKPDYLVPARHLRDFLTKTKDSDKEGVNVSLGDIEREMKRQLQMDT